MMMMMMIKSYLNPGSAEPRNIGTTLTNLKCVALKYADARADLLMTIRLSYSIGPPQSLYMAENSLKTPWTFILIYGKLRQLLKIQGVSLKPPMVNFVTKSPGQSLYLTSSRYSYSKLGIPQSDREGDSRTFERAE